MKRVFVVEDEAIVAMELKDHLRSMGYEVCGHAARGEAALRAILELRPDLVLMDINLGGGMTGLDVAERLRGVFDVPLLFITAYSDGEITERVGRSGSFGYLVKPFEPRVLGANIELALARHSATIALRASEERFRELSEQLRQSQERYELALEGADLGAWDWNIQTGAVIFNSRWAEMRGFALDEVEPHVNAWISGVHPDDLPRVQRVLTDYHDGKAPAYEVEHRAATKSGEWIWVLDRGKVFERDEQGRPIRMVGTELDITARRRSEEALRMSEARNRAMVAAIPDPLLRIDKDLRYLDVAASDPSQLALPPEALRGKTIAEAFGSLSPGLVQESTEAIRRALDTGGLQRFEYSFRQWWFEARIIRSSPGEVLEILRDITDRKRAEELLRAAVESRESLLAAVAHDLRSPLSAIQMSAHLLARASLSDEHPAPSKPLDVILCSVKRMGRLIEDLLQAATIEAGKFTLEPGREDVLPIIEEALHTFEPEATARAVRLERAVPAGLPTIHCDRIRVIQVLSNLIGNALKFVPDGGSIEVRVSVSAGDGCFAVRDDGPGITEDQLRHLFDRYWKGQAEGHRGIGLGLYISKGIVEAHGGRIWVESQVGVGSTFYFTIPLG